MKDCLALVLAGGEGRRLAPLTAERSKPAVYFGGRYRLIDFVLSNLVNSGFHRIKVLTQYRATSLVRHLSRSWPLSSGVLDQFVEVVPASMNLGPTWFRGTADAIWQNLDLLRDTQPEDVLVFGSDHIYKMDVSKMLAVHRDTGADVTVASLPIAREEASGLGCIAVDDAGRVTGFLEKPAEPPPMPGDPGRCLVSMGNYIFKTSALIAELRRDAERDSTHDFGHDILTTAHERMHVQSYDFTTQLCPGESERGRGYWRDVGSLDAYHAASMDLVSVEPMLNLYNARWPIRGLQPLAGPAKFVFADHHGGRVGVATDSIVGAGTIVSGARLERSIAFHNVRLNSYAVVRESVLFPGAEVGRGARLVRCIVDKGVHIAPGEVIGEDVERDRARGFRVSEGGVVVVTRRELGQVDAYDAPTQQT